MSRLPTPGSDDGTWGTILNDYLSQQHQGDGTHKYDSIIPSVLDSAKPSALAANTGLLYLSTDVASGTLYRSNGSSWVKVARGASENSLSASYLITTDGTTITGRNANGVVVSTGADGGAVLTALLPAASSVGAEIVFGDGSFTWSTVPALPKGITGKLTIRGSGATKITLSSAAPRFVDLNRTASGDSFQNVVIKDFTIDNNGLAQAATNAVVVGTMRDNNVSASGQQIDIKHFRVENINCINMPANTTNKAGVVYLVSYHSAGGLAQNVITDVVIRNVRSDGGNFGITVAASGPSTGINVYWDEITFENCYSTTGFVPTGAGASSNYQVGSVGFGGRFKMLNCYGSGSMDVGIEVDAADDAVIENCTFEDCWNAHYFFTNFQAPAHPNSQVIRIINSVGTLKTAQTFTNGKFCAVTVNNAIPMGQIQITGCTWWNASGTFAGQGEFLAAPTTVLKKFVARDITFVQDSIAYSAAGAISPCYFLFQQTSGTTNVVMHNIRYLVTGARTGGSPGAVTFKPLRFDNAATYDLDLDHGEWSMNFTNATNNGLAMSDLGEVATTNRGRIARQKYLSVGDDAGPRGFLIRGTATLTVSGKLLFEDNDWSIMPNASSNCLFIVTGTQNKDKVLARNNLYPTAIAPTTMTGVVTATGQQLLTDWDAIVSFQQGTGAGITAIDISTDGGTTYKNILTQAAAAMPAGPSLQVGPLRSLDYVKVTFTTTQPTINVIPYNP